MNNLDMYTRENANKIHLEELHREAQSRRMLRDVKSEGDLKNIAVNRGRYIALAVLALIVAIAALLVVSNIGFLHTL